MMTSVSTWSITTLTRANLLSERFSKRAPAAIRIHSLVCCRGHRDTSALTSGKNTMRLAIDERCDRCVEIPNCTRATGLSLFTLSADVHLRWIGHEAHADYRLPGLCRPTGEP